MSQQGGADSKASPTEAAVPTAHECGCNAACEGIEGVGKIMHCVNSCLEGCRLEALERRQFGGKETPIYNFVNFVKENGMLTRLSGGYPSRPLPTSMAEADPAPYASSSSAFFYSSPIAPPASSFPVSPVHSGGLTVPAHDPKPHHVTEPQEAHPYVVPSVTSEHWDPAPTAHHPEPASPGYPTGEPPAHKPAHSPVHSRRPTASKKPAHSSQHPSQHPTASKKPAADPAHSSQHSSASHKASVAPSHSSRVPSGVGKSPAGPSHPAQPSAASPKAPVNPGHPVQPPSGGQKPPVDPSHPVHPPSGGQKPPGDPSHSAPPPPSGHKPPVDPSHPAPSPSGQKPPMDPWHSAPPSPGPKPPVDPPHAPQPPHDSPAPPPQPPHDSPAPPPHDSPAPPPSSPHPTEPPYATEEPPTAAPAAIGDKACAQTCTVKCQHADIAFDVSQCRSHCYSACIQEEKAGILIDSGHVSAERKGHTTVPKPEAVSKPNALVKPNAIPKPNVGPVVGANAENYKACVQACYAKGQHADIAFDVSTGEGGCKSACAARFSSTVNILDKKDAVVEVRSKKPKHPEVPAIGASVSAYEACLSDCRSKYQSADIAFEVSQGSMSCKTACAKYSDSEVHILDKKDTVDTLDTRSKKPKHPEVPAIGVSSSAYEACLSDCRSKYQSADIAFEVSQGSMSCKTACAKYQSSEVHILDKKDTLDTRSKKTHTPVGPAIGASATAYEACLSDCRSKYQSADIAFKVSQGSMSCKAACARHSDSEVHILDKKDTLDARSKKTHTPVGPAIGASITTYEGCMSDCRSRYQSADIAFEVSQGSMSCKTACAKYESSEVHILDKKDTLDVRTKKPQPEAPAVGVGATTYEACLSDCKSKYQSADIAFEVSQGSASCKTACAKYASSDVNIIGKRDTIENKDTIETRSKKPQPETPVVSVGSTAYEVCLSDCKSKYQSADIAFEVSQGSASCKAACAKYASSDVNIIGKKDTIENKDTIEVRAKKPEPETPAVGIDASTYEACVSDCLATYQTANIVFEISQGKKHCESACARSASAGVGIGKKDVIL
ncbi:hypothetical protein GGR50DRAFT_495060 [Xylaria sp. CBS 124048]|nr:hypothetical protein GGR50DRAFT_495060 [Xylaria sp. CBS 124048]